MENPKRTVRRGSQGNDRFLPVITLGMLPVSVLLFCRVYSFILCYIQLPWLDPVPLPVDELLRLYPEVVCRQR